MNCKVVTREIKNFLREQYAESGVDGFVVGISGGIDSAVVSKLCAMTNIDTVVANVPINSDPNKRAVNHINDLLSEHDNVEKAFPDLTEVNSAFERVLQQHDLDDGLTRANLQSRLRMCCLYSFANSRGLLVVGTGNKVEDAGVGFFTKYGDGGVDISPIGDLLKTEVYELAEYLGIRDEILEADPTDGLWDDNRSDEEQLGMTYEEIERFMMVYERLGGTTRKAQKNAVGGDEEKLEKYKEFVEWHESTRHKMSMPPICKLPEDVKHADT